MESEQSLNTEEIKAVESFRTELTDSAKENQKASETIQSASIEAYKAQAAALNSEVVSLKVHRRLAMLLLIVFAIQSASMSFGMIYWHTKYEKLSNMVANQIEFQLDQLEKRK